MDILSCPTCGGQLTAEPGAAGQPAVCPQCALTATIAFVDPQVASPISEDLGQIGAYRVLKLLGAGGMGQVFQALHTRLEKVVALKVLPAGRLSSKDSIARFEREMMAVGRLNHPHIVRALDAGEFDGTHYLAMEFVQGIDLAQLVKKLGPLPAPDACELVRQAALGLQAAHEAGMVHRDIKPSNLMLCQPAHKDAAPLVKMLDLGLALLSAVQSNERTGLTSKGSVMGTIDYMAPEQGGDSHLVDIRADIYSLGATLYALLAGVAPYSDSKYDSAIKKLMALATRPPTPIRVRQPGVPVKLAEVIGRMLARNRDQRFASPDKAAAALAPFCTIHDLARLLARARGETPAPDPNRSTAIASHAPTRDLAEASVAQSKMSGRRRLSIAAGVVLAGLLLAAAVASMIDRKPVSESGLPKGDESALNSAADKSSDRATSSDEPSSESKIVAMAAADATRPGNRQHGDRAESAAQDDKHVDLLGAVSLSVDTISGEWHREGTVVECRDGANYPRFRSRHLPPDEYELTAVVERLSGDDAIEIGLVIAGRPARLILDGFKPRLCGLELIDGRESNANETTFRETVLTNEQPSSLRVTFRRRSIRVVVDDRQIIDWEGDPARFTAAKYYALPDPQPL